MATADSVKAKIQGLIDSVNATTGNSDADLTTAVEALIAGFGQGGGSSGASGIYMAKITPASNLDNFKITHNLGTTDILYVAVWAESLGGITPTDRETLCKFWAKTDITTRRGGGGFSNGYNWTNASSYADSQSPNTSAYEKLTVTDENNVFLPRCTSGSSTYYLAGVTYTVFVIAANAEV